VIDEVVLKSYNEFKMSTTMREDEQVAEAESRMAAEVGMSPWVGWGEAVDAFYAAAA
jgi:hypothetical protein